MTAMLAVACSRRNRSPDKPNEDAFAVHLDAEGAVLVVADGVTRSRDAAGRYPDPSGAALAARLAARELAAALAAGDGTPDLAAAFARANRAIDRANRAHGVWARLDYGAHDLWGVVATAVAVRAGIAHWGHLGDTALLHLPAAGGLISRARDQVAAASAWLDALPAAELAAAGGRDPYARRHLRNHPGLAHSYGVLTGEEAALAYVETGSFALAPDDRLGLLSDGLGSLRRSGDAGAWAALDPWLRADPADDALERLLDAAEEADARSEVRSDDKTVVVGDLSPDLSPSRGAERRREAWWP